MKKESGCNWVEDCIKNYINKGYSRERAEEICWGALQRQEHRTHCDFCEKEALVVGETIFGEPAKMCRECYKKFGIKKAVKI